MATCKLPFGVRLEELVNERPIQMRFVFEVLIIFMVHKSEHFLFIGRFTVKDMFLTHEINKSYL